MHLSISLANRGVRAVVAVVALGSLPGCGSSELTEVSAFPNVATVRLVIAGRTVSIDALGKETGGPAVIIRNTTVNVSATFHMPNGVVDPHVKPETFQLNLEHTAGAPLTFTRSETNPFAGTITATNVSGGSSLRMALHNRLTGATQFGPYQVTIAITD